MENIITYIKYGFTALISGLGWLVGGFDTMMIVLLLFMGLDYLTGVLCAYKKKKLSSKKGAEGIFKKAVILMIIVTAYWSGVLLEMEGLRYLVISFYLANEGISILENAAILDIPIPKPVKDALKQIQEKYDEDK